MGDDTSTALTKHSADTAQLQKEAVDALANQPVEECRETFDYFKSLIEFKKHAATNPSRPEPVP